MTEAPGASAPSLPDVNWGQLLKQTAKGNRKALPTLKAALDAYPRIWNDLGDAAKHTRDSLIRRAAGDKDLGQQEIYARKLKKMTRDLAGATPSPLEQLLAERIVLCWFHLHYVESLYIQNMPDSTLRQAEAQQRRISTAQARYLSAIRTLAQVRRLGVPAMQVNIAEQQVNVSR